MDIKLQSGESILGTYKILDDTKGNVYITTKHLIISSANDKKIDSQFKWSQILEIYRSDDDIMIITNIADSQGAYQSFGLKFDNIEEVLNTIQTISSQTQVHVNVMGIAFRSNESILGTYKILDDIKGNAYVTSQRLIIGSVNDEEIDSEFEWSEVKVYRSDNEIMIKTKIIDSKDEYQSFGFKFDNIGEVYNKIQDRLQQIEVESSKQFESSSLVGSNKQVGVAPSNNNSYAHKSPGIALLLGLLFFPGLGVLYIGKIKEGIAFLFSGILILVITLIAVLQSRYYSDSVIVGSIVAVLIVVIIELYALYYGYSRAKQYNEYVEQNNGKTPW